MKFWTAKQLAERWNLSVGTINYRRNAGRINGKWSDEVRGFVYPDTEVERIDAARGELMSA